MRLVVLATHPVQYQAPWFRALVDEGVDLQVLFGLLPDPRQQATGFERAFTWDVPLVDGYPWRALRQTRREPNLGRFLGLRCADVGRTILECDPDVVVLTGWNSYLLLQGLRAAAQLGIPTVARGDSNALRKRPSWTRAGHRALLSCYDAFVGVGVANRTFYESHGVEPDRIVDGGHFVDEDRFLAEARRDLPRREELRRSWGIPPDSCCFVFAGKLETKKRPLDFVRAVGRAREALGAGSVHGLVVGSGEMETAVREAAAGEKASFTFTGFLNQSAIGSAYAAADALVLPSDWGETWGLVVNEAMLFGRPVIVSDRAGCGPDLVREGVTGYLVAFGDVSALAAAMVRMASSPAQRLEMGQYAKKRVLGFSPKRGARATIEAARIASGRC